MNEESEPQQLRFPLDCHYRIIAEDSEGIRARIETALMECGVNKMLKDGNTSANGTYVTFFVDVHVTSIEQMRLISTVLGSVNGVKMVL